MSVPDPSVLQSHLDHGAVRTPPALRSRVEVLRGRAELPIVRIDFRNISAADLYALIPHARKTILDAAAGKRKGVHTLTLMEGAQTDPAVEALMDLYVPANAEHVEGAAVLVASLWMRAKIGTYAIVKKRALKAYRPEEEPAALAWLVGLHAQEVAPTPVRA